MEFGFHLYPGKESKSSIKLPRKNSTAIRGLMFLDCVTVLISNLLSSWIMGSISFCLSTQGWLTLYRIEEAQS